MKTIKEIQSFADKHTGLPVVKAVGNAKGLRGKFFNSGTVTFEFHRNRNGKRIKVNIGHFGDVSLAQANEYAGMLGPLVDAGRTSTELTKAVQASKSPQDLYRHFDASHSAKVAATAGKTFGYYHMKYYEGEGSKWKNKAHVQANLSIPRNHLQHIYDRPMIELRRADYIEAFKVDGLWENMQPTAEKACTLIMKVIEAYTDDDEDYVSPFTSAADLRNRVARQISNGGNHVERSQPYVTHERVREWYENWTSRREEGMANLAAMALIFSIKRASEVAGLRWDQLGKWQGNTFVYDKDLLWRMKPEDGKTTGRVRGARRAAAKEQLYLTNITPRLRDVFEQARKLAEKRGVSTRKVYVFASDTAAAGHITVDSIRVQMHKTIFGEEQSSHGWRGNFTGWAKSCGYEQTLYMYCMNQSQGGIIDRYGNYPVQHLTKPIMQHWEEFLTGEADADEKRRDIFTS